MLTWLLKNWKVVALALALSGLCIAGIKLYRMGQASERQSNQITTLTAQRDFWIEWNKKSADALADNANKAIQDTKSINDLKTRITTLDAYIDSLEDRDRECFDGTDTDRLRDLWNNPGGAKASTSTR